MNWMVALLLSVVCGLSACVGVSPAIDVRPPSPLAAAVALDLEPQSVARNLSLRLLAAGDGLRRFRLRFQAYSEAAGDYVWVEGEYYEPDGAIRGLIALSPILAGPVDDYLATRFLASAAAARRHASFFLYQERLIFDPRRDSPAMEAWARENVRAYRSLLTPLSRMAGQGRLGSIGVSLGGIKNVLLLASESRLEANVLALAGGGLDELVLSSSEPLVGRYLQGRLRLDGASSAEVSRELSVWFSLEPLILAESVASDSVQLMIARFDQAVPYAGGRLLREALGGVGGIRFYLGHYTSIFLAPWIASRALSFLEERWELLHSTNTVSR